jgi:hypothetical protein
VEAWDLVQGFGERRDVKALNLLVGDDRHGGEGELSRQGVLWCGVSSRGSTPRT